jgi:hypothetical protein
MLVLTSACGQGGFDRSAKGLSSSQALVSTAEWLEFEPLAVRHELFNDLARQSQAQAGHVGAVLFPMLVNGEFIAAPALDARADLLSATDAGGSVVISFDRDAPFSEDRRDAFQGLSEREAAELIGRSLLQQWGLHPSAPVTIVRVAGAPYAAAWIDSQLRLNPAFVYLAAAEAPQ